jgi:hypothetical protein
VYLRTQQSRTQSLPNNGRNAIEAVVINNNSSSVGRIKEQLGKVHPLMHSRRLQAHKSHVADDWQPKGLDISPLVEPLSLRHQAHLSYNFSAHMQDQLGAGKLSVGNDGRKRRSFRDIDPISISPAIPLTNEITGRRLANALPRLL